MCKNCLIRNSIGKAAATIGGFEYFGAVAMPPGQQATTKRAPWLILYTTYTNNRYLCCCYCYCQWLLKCLTNVSVRAAINFG